MSPVPLRDTIHKTSVPCECLCSSVIVVEYEQWGDDPHQMFVEFGLSWGDARLSKRIKAAWGILRRRDPWLHGVALDKKSRDQLVRALTGQA